MFKHHFSDSQSYPANTNTARGKGCVKSDVQCILNAKSFLRVFAAHSARKRKRFMIWKALITVVTPAVSGSWLLALKELSKNSIKRYTTENIFLFTSERKSDMSFTLQ